jgi:hypothetical protein
MVIVWSLPLGDCHPILLQIFTKLHQRAGPQPQDWKKVSAILFHSIRGQGRKAGKAPVSTKMKPGARILRTIA